MKRQGPRQTKLEAYFGKRSRIVTPSDDQPDDVVVVSTGRTALQMIADAYGDEEVEHEAEEQAVSYADLADVALDHDYCALYANLDHVEHDHSYAGPSSIPVQRGGAFGFDSSDDDEPAAAVVDIVSDNADEEEDEEYADEAVSDEELHLEDLYEVVDHRVKRVKKFGLNGYATKFVLKDDERVDHPVEMLRHVLQRFIDEALENSNEYGYSTDWMGLSFITESMKKGNGGKGEWLVPFNPPNENNADKILQEMEKFDQSENSPELFGNQITMVVTTIRRPEGGAMDRLIRKKQIRRPKKDPAIVEINNRDSLCLFRATAVHMFYHETGEGSWQAAERYARKGELDLDAVRLRARAGLKRKPAYGIKEAEKVFEYLERKYPGVYRILIISDRSKTETVYNSGNKARYDICLYHHKGHFDVIKTPQKFFGAKHYCVDCEKTYSNIAAHRDCVLRCAQCFRSGPGYPCTGDWKDEYECHDCRKFFANKECMDAHKPYSCNTYHRCPFCEVHYRYEAGKKNGGHKCGYKYCRRCCKKHTRDVGCFIRPLQAKKPTPHRIVAYDVEAIIQKSQRLSPRDAKETGSEVSTVEQMHTAAPFLVDDDGNDITMEEDGAEDEAPPRRRNPFVSMEVDEDSDEDEEIQSQKSSETEEEFGVSDDPSRTDHEVNYIAAIVMCSECIDDWTWADYENQNCKICGPQKVFKCGEWELPEGRDVVDEFLDFLLYELPDGFPTYAYAHNGGRYDGAFMLQKLQARPKLRPSVTSAGHKYFQISVKKSKHNNAVSFRDSCLLFPMKLEDAPDAYDLPVKPKGDFPYLYKMHENYGKPVDGLPPPEDYILSRFKNTVELNAFLKRHEEEDKKRREEGTPFVLEDVLEEYCFNDVEILAHALLEFRAIFNVEAGCDLFVECTTITSGCIKLWRRKYLKDNTVAIVPNNGYGQHDRQSAVALKYLKWFEWAHGVNMQYCTSDNGEKEIQTSIGWKKLDGFIDAKAWDSPGFKKCNVAACPYCELLPDQKIAIEFNGCAYHGCPFKCFPNDTKLPTGKMSGEQLEISQNRIDAIKREGYHVIEVWECQLKEELKKNKQMRDFFEHCFDTGHIQPRDGFYGGRVGPMRLHYKPGPDEEIKFFDIVSLYPHVLRSLFPVGHPEVHRYFQEKSWDAEMWRNTYKDKYKGVFKVLVLPPKDLTIPVLPMRDNNRLLFPLCRTCAMDSRKASPYREPSCQHMELERACVTMTTHVELDLAFEAGYNVMRVIEVWNYKKWDNTIFEGYITDFMRLKEEATGWEDIAKIEDPEERDQAMDKFIDEYFENTKRPGKDGVRLRKDHVKENKALRSVMKLFLNSLWGRLAMRPNKSHTEIIRSPAKLYKLLDSTSKVVKNIIQIDKDTMRVEWCYVERFAPEDENSNVVYAMFTTSYGRAELYKHMCAVKASAGGAKGAKFLYGDTDSIIYVRKKGTEPIVAGRYLGDMKDEYPKHTIEEFICGGNKQYGLLLRHKATGELTTKQKIRGITLNSVTSEMIRYEKMKEMILNPRRPDGEVPTVRLPYTVIRRDHHAKVYSLAMEKIYRPIFMKGWIDSNLEIWPHGYIKPEERGVNDEVQMNENEYYMTLVL